MKFRIFSSISWNKSPIKNESHKYVNSIKNIPNKHKSKIFKFLFIDFTLPQGIKPLISDLNGMSLIGNDFTVFHRYYDKSVRSISENRTVVKQDFAIQLFTVPGFHQSHDGIMIFIIGNTKILYIQNVFILDVIQFHLSLQASFHLIRHNQLRA